MSPVVDDTDEIRRRLNERLEEVVARFWPGHVKRGKIAYCAPTGRADDLGSFEVHLAALRGSPRGHWFRNSQGIGGDEINLFAYGLTGSHRATAEVFREIRQFVGLDNAKPETPEQRERREALAVEAAAKRAADDKRAAERAQARVLTAGEDWADAIPIAGTHAEAYLLARGLVQPPEGWGPSLRFAGRMVYDLDRTLWFPALVCRVDDVFGDLTAIWKIYLDPKKPTKAPVEKAKLGTGVAVGGAVRLGGIGPRIGLGEGLETCLAARALVKYRYPVWAALSTAGVAGFEPPLEVEHITSFPDGDRPWRKHGDAAVSAEPAGRAAVRKLRERMLAIGRGHDAQREPKMFQDFLDIWQARRRAEGHTWQ